MMFAQRIVASKEKKESLFDDFIQMLLSVWTGSLQEKEKKQQHANCKMWREILWGTVKPEGRFMEIATANRKNIRKLFDILSIVLFLIGFIGTAAANPLEPFWKLGRAKIEQQMDSSGQKQFYLKLSLRNEGKPGKSSVQILGRWGRSVQPQEQESFIQLGKYTQEVALKQTAILVISLQPLGAVPQEKPFLELVIMTGSLETDRQLISLP